MASIEELVVRAKPEGLEETSQGFNDMQDELEETEAQMDDSADSFGGMAAKWKGALGAITAGLAVAVGGLLSQVPILDETMGALNGIIAGVAFSIDKELRPSLSGLNEDLRETQTEVYEADSAVGALDKAINGVKDAVETFTVKQIQNEIETLTGIKLPEDWIELGLDFVTMDIRGIFKNGKDVIRNFKSDYRDVSRQVANAVLNEFDSLSQRANTKWQNFKSDLISKAKGIWSGVKGWFQDLSDDVVAEADRIWSDVKSRFSRLKEDVSGFFDDLISDAMSWGRQMIQNLVGGIRDNVGLLTDVLSKFAPDKLANRVETELRNAFEVTANGGNGGGGNTFTPTSPVPQVNLDGRDVTSETGRYRRDPLSRRGRNG